MAESKIPDGKKRYSLTLTVETMDWLQTYLKARRVGTRMISEMVDESLSEMVKTFQELEAMQNKSGQPVGFGELLTVIGNRFSDKDQKKLL